MNSHEKIMRELLYDFRRFFDQMKADGVEAVETGRPPRERRTKKNRPALARRPVEPPSGSQAPPSVQARFADLVGRICVCRKCPLAETRKKAVPGEGGHGNRILLVGEGPGAEEDRLGRPFVGRSGQLLDKILSSIELSRNDVYITNIVKCRPPNNRDPQSDEVIACWPYLDEQIKLLQPRVIVTLGSPAVKTLLDTETGIGRLRGRFHDYKGIPLLPTYHPAYLLRAYTPENRKKVWQDVKMLRDFLQKPE